MVFIDTNYLIPFKFIFIAFSPESSHIPRVYGMKRWIFVTQQYREVRPDPGKILLERGQMSEERTFLGRWKSGRVWKTPETAKYLKSPVRCY